MIKRRNLAIMIGRSNDHTSHLTPRIRSCRYVSKHAMQAGRQAGRPAGLLVNVLAVADFKFIGER
jgi:hypothetical protein